MKIAISSQGKELDSPLDPRFGRAQGFIIYDLETGDHSYMPNNQNLNLPQGAGLQTAQNVAAAGVDAVVTGHVGPKAFTALSKGGIGIYLCDEKFVSLAIQAMSEQRLRPADQADKEGHW